MKQYLHIRMAAALLFIVPLAACGGEAEKPAEGEGKSASEYEKGPHNGRMLRDGDFAIEVTIFEDGQPPQYRMYPTRGNNPVDPSTVNLAVTLTRLGGQIDRFAFNAETDFLAGDGVVTEPHSFDVQVVATENGKRHVWKFANPEGRTKIRCQKQGATQERVIWSWGANAPFFTGTQHRPPSRAACCNATKIGVASIYTLSMNQRKSRADLAPIGATPASRGHLQS